MSDDFRIDPRTQLPPSVFDLQPHAPAPSGGGHARAQMAAGHGAGHHPDDLPREAAHGLHTALETCEKARHGYEAIRQNPNPQALQRAIRELDAGARRLNGAVARLEVLNEAEVPKAAAALPGARRRLSEVRGLLGKAQAQLTALRAGIGPRARASGRQLLDTVEHQPKQPAAAVAAGHAPQAGRLGRVLDKAHAFAARPGVRGVGRFASVAGAALDAYQGWRESTSDHPYWRARTAVAYTIAGQATSRSLAFAIPDLLTGGAVSDHFKRTALTALAGEQALVSGSTKPFEVVADRSARGEHGRVWQALSKVGTKIVP